MPAPLPHEIWRLIYRLTILQPLAVNLLDGCGDALAIISPDFGLVAKDTWGLVGWPGVKAESVDTSDTAPAGSPGSETEKPEKAKVKPMRLGSVRCRLPHRTPAEKDEGPSPERF